MTSSGIETGVVSMVSELSGTDSTGSNRVIGLVETSEYSCISVKYVWTGTSRTFNVGSLTSIVDGVYHFSIFD